MILLGGISLVFFILLLPIGLVLTFIASNNRGLIEDFYSQGFFYL